MNTNNGIAARTILIAIVALILATLAFAHGNEQHVMGTVTKIDAGSITVKTTRGEMKTVMILASTKFVKGTSSAAQQDLKVGDRVVIHAKPEGDMLHGTEVKIADPTQGMVHQH